MADVTISQLSSNLPTSSSSIPFTDSGTTFKVSPSGIFAKTGSQLFLGTNDSIDDLSPVLGSATNLSAYNAVLRGGWLLNVTDRTMSWGDSAARIGVLRQGGGNGWWFSHNLDGSGAIHQSSLGDRLRIDPDGGVNLPAQPGFSATINSQSQSTGQVVVWDTLIYETPAGSFNTSTGIWTVPQSGRYLVTVNLISQRNTTGGDWYIDLQVNGGVVSGGRMYTSKAGNLSVHAQLNASGIFYLSKNSQVRTLLSSTVGNVSPAWMHNLFCAQLLS